MNEEIKEIIMQLKTAIDFKNSPMPMNYQVKIEYINKLLDYITNLQQENEMMRKLIDEGVENSYKKLKYLQQENERLKELYKEAIDDDLKETLQRIDYKSRCVKALSIIDKQKKKMYKSRNKIALFVLMKLENILQGSDNNGN